MSDNNGQPDTAYIGAIHHSVHTTAKALQSVIRLLEAQAQELAVGGAPNDRIIEDWPVPGLTRRSVSNRRSSGTDAFSVAAATPALLVDANLGRLGGTIVNSGSNGATIYLCDKERVSGSTTSGIAAIFLAANGGSWDFRLGNVLWCGAVSVISTNGTTFTIAQA